MKALQLLVGEEFVEAQKLAADLIDYTQSRASTPAVGIAALLAAAGGLFVCFPGPKDAVRVALHALFDGVIDELEKQGLGG